MEPTIPTAGERRQTTRIECCYQVECSQQEATFPASVINMGLGGLRFLSERPMTGGTSLTIGHSALHLGQIQVEIVWTRESGGLHESGAVYRSSPEQLDHSWVKAALQRLGFDSTALYERRRHVRARTQVGGQLIVDGVQFPCSVLDLGMGGFLVRTETSVPRLAERQPLLLTVDVQGAEPLAASVVYIRNLDDGKWNYGLCFDGDRLTQAQARLVEGYLQALR